MVVKKELLRVQDVVAEGSVDAVVSGRVSIPQEKPAAQKFLSIIDVTVDATATPLRDKVVVQGTITLQIIYVSTAPDQPVHHTHETLSFLQFVDVPGAQPGMRVLLRPKVQFASAVLVDPRTFEIEVVINLFVKVLQERQLEVVTGVEFKSIPVRVMKKLVRVESVVAENSAQANVRAVTDVPAGKPDVAKIIRVVDSRINLTEVRTIPDRVVVQGTLTLQILYVSTAPDQPVHQMHLTVPFFQHVNVPGTRAGMMALVFPSVEFVSATIVSPRTIRIEAILRLFAKITELQQLRVVTDVRSDRIPVDTDKELLLLEDVVTEATKQINIRQQVAIPPAKPNAQKILEIADATVNITRAEVLDNKVVVEGTVTTQTIYVAAAVDQPVHHMSHTISFVQFVDLPGARPGMSVLVFPTVEFASATLVPVGDLPYGGTNQILFDIIIELFVKVTKPEQVRVVTDVRTPENWSDC